jgi:hypothetical protein
MLASPLYPDRLEFRLPEFARVAWASETARRVWAPRLTSICKAWAEIEWRAILAGVRSCALVRLSERQLLESAECWFAHGLEVEPLRLEDGARTLYQAAARPLQSDAPPIVCAVVGRGDDLREFRRAWGAGDHDKIGSLLGYPPCCRRFFKEVWVEAECIDTTWAMALNSASASLDRTIEVSGPAAANILWRWLGVRAVPHLPCAFDCQASAEFGEKLKDVGRQNGFGEAVNWIEEILDWPVEWSALHGIAEIKTPILKVSTSTDATADKYVVRRNGSAYPAEGSRGLHFPFIPPRRRLVADSRAYHAGLANPISEGAQFEDWHYRDNGFSSRMGMDRLHAPLVELARRATEGLDGKIIDLGCGNGTLLAKICEGRAGLIPFGIDANEGAIVHARSIHAGRPHNFIVGDMFDADAWSGERPFALAILMLGRLLEQSPEDAARFMAALRTSCACLLLYVYPGWSKEAFPALLARAGIAADHVDNKRGVALLALN